MSLRGFHLLFIGASTALAVGIAVYCFRLWRDGGGAGPLAGGIAAVLAAVALVVYGRWFLRKMTRLMAVGLAACLLSADAVHACEVCFGQASGSMIDGARMGVVLLLAVTLGVQGAFVWFFVQLRRRARRAAQDTLNTEWSDLQMGPIP